MPSVSLKDAAIELAQAYALGKIEYENANPGYSVIVTCVWRSPEEQQGLYALGRTKPGQIVTQIDGVTKLSNHNHKPSRAIDFAIVFAGKIVWNALGEFAEAASFFKKHGAKWGGDWKTFKDYPHIEV